MQIKFEGQGHQIDSNTLINALIHYNTIIAESNKELSGGSKAIAINVSALKEGSFIIDINLAENPLLSVFSNDGVQYLAGLVTVVTGVFGIYKVLKGKPAITTKDRESIVSNFKIDGNKVTITNSIINVYNQPVVREAISKSIETADNDPNVEGLSITGRTDSRPVVFDKKEFKDLIYTDFDKELERPLEIDEIVETSLTIIGLNFEKGSRWQFLFNGFKIGIIVKDDALMARINEGERFGKGDSIRVKMKITKLFNTNYNAYENKSYRIIEFLEHILAPRQDKLF